MHAASLRSMASRMSEIEIIPTNTCPQDLGELTRRSEGFSNFARTIHLDISDGKFTQVTSWPFMKDQWRELENLRRLPCSDVARYEAHLMVEESSELGALLGSIGCGRVIGHIEAFGNESEITSALSRWKSVGAREVGVALLIDTPLELLEKVAVSCDFVLLMSIASLGSQGAPFDQRIYERIESVAQKYPALSIAVDGGVNPTNIESLVRAGARRFGVGSAISRAPDQAEAYRSLVERAQSALE